MGQGRIVVRLSSDGTGWFINLPKSGGGRGNCHPCQLPTTAGPVMQDQPDAARHTVGQSNQECKETSEPNLSNVERLDLRFLQNNFGFSHTFDSEVCYCKK